MNEPTETDEGPARERVTSETLTRRVHLAHSLGVVPPEVAIPDLDLVADPTGPYVTLVAQLPGGETEMYLLAPAARRILAEALLAPDRPDIVTAPASALRRLNGQVE